MVGSQERELFGSTACCVSRTLNLTNFVWPINKQSTRSNTWPDWQSVLWSRISARKNQMVLSCFREQGRLTFFVPFFPHLLLCSSAPEPHEAGPSRFAIQKLSSTPSDDLLLPLMSLPPGYFAAAFESPSESPRPDTRRIPIWLLNYEIPNNLNICWRLSKTGQAWYGTTTSNNFPAIAVFENDTDSLLVGYANLGPYSPQDSLT